MSYSIDRSARTRGVGAVASYDLREGGGLVVRTGQGPVTIIRKPLGATSSQDGGGSGRGRSAGFQAARKKTPPKKGHKAPPGFVWVAARGGHPGHWERKRVVTAAQKRGLIGFFASAQKGLPGQTNIPSEPAVSPFTNGGLSTQPSGGGGGSSGGGGGGGGAFTPDSANFDQPDEFAQASEQEIREQEAALEAQQQGGGGPEAAPGAGGGQTASQDAAVSVGPDGRPVAKPMSTGVKVAVAAGIGYLLLSMLKGH